MKHRPLLLTTLLLLCVAVAAACATGAANTPAGFPSPEPTSTPQPASTLEPSTPAATPPGSVTFDVVCGRGIDTNLSLIMTGAQPELLLLTADDIEGIGLCPEESYETGAINFDSHFIVGVFRGRMPHGGLDIAVQEVSIVEDTATVVVRLTEPTLGTPVITAVTYPYQLIAIDKDSVAGVSAWEMVTTGGRKLAST